MRFTPAQDAEIFAKLRTLEELRVYFQLTDEQLQHPGAGQYLIQRFKNNEQSVRLFREKLSTRDFPADPPFPGAIETAPLPETAT